MSGSLAEVRSVSGGTQTSPSITFMISSNANPTLEKAIETVKVQVVADPKGCGDLFNPVGTRVFSAPCDLARDFLAKSSVKYDTVAGPAGSPVTIRINGKDVTYTKPADSNAAATEALQAAGYPKRGANPTLVKMSNPFDIFRPQVAAVIGLLFILVIFVTMSNVRGIAADAASAIVQRLTGVLPDGGAVNSAVDASLKG